MQSVEDFLLQSTTDAPAGSVVHAHATLPAVHPPSREMPRRFPPWLVALLRTQGITRLSEPQWQALEFLHQGQHVCLGLPTGGGRGVVRLLALYQLLAVDGPGHGLCILPHKQREWAQFRAFTAWNDTLDPEHRLPVAIYDGDTPRTQRRAIKQAFPRVLLTTPEMLHLGILAYHDGWRAFFQHLRYVVLPDLHLCTGALGSHLAHVLRRLQRLVHHYGGRPQYLLTSAPLAHLDEVARTLTAQACTVVAGEAFATHPQSRLLLTASANPLAVCRALIARQSAAGLHPLILAPYAIDWPEVETPERHAGSDSVQEAYHTAALRLLRGESAAVVLPSDTPVAAVRPGVVSSVIFLGLPPSLTLLHEYLTLLASHYPHSVSTLILQGKTPLERYLLRYPAVYQTRWPQTLVLYPSHPQIAKQHLHCAAAELALGAGERYGGIHGLANLIQQLASEKIISRDTASQAWVAVQRRPHRRVRLRAYTPACAVVNILDQHFLAHVAPAPAFRDYFVGAVYTDHGTTWRVERHAKDGYRIFVHPVQADALTRSLIDTTVTGPLVEASVEHETLSVTVGSCLYTETLRAFERLEARTMARVSVHSLPETQRQYRTQGVWFEVLGAPPVSFTAVHTFVHAVLMGLPLVFLSDVGALRGDIYTGPGKESPAAIFSDSEAGGNGVSSALYREHERVLRIGLQLLLQCDCAQGCGKCIAALRCDTCIQHGEALDRQEGIKLLQRLLGEVVPPFEAVTVAAPPPVPLDRALRVIYLALSTQKSAEDVGGWQHKHLLGLGVAVTYDTRDERYRVYADETAEALLDSLREADLIVGFNTRDFDYQVLQPYTDMPLTTLPTFALLDEIQRALGFRFSLRHVVRETLGIEHPDESIRALHWYQEGDRERVAQQCRRNIDLVRALVHHVTETGTLVYRDQTGARQLLHVPWALAEYAQAQQPGC
jgi:DEAD/DEAH box helicase domain-containing protein